MRGNGFDMTTGDGEKNYLQAELEYRMQHDLSMWNFLQKGSLDGLWYWDLEKPENEWMSPEFWRLFGIDPATKRHDPAEWQDIIFADDLAVAVDNFQKHVADPSHPYDQIVRYRHANGSTVWVRCRGIALRDAQGKAIRMLGAHNDLTAAMRAREEVERTQDALEAMREAELRARLIDQSHDAILTYDETGKILSWNRGAELLYGHRRIEVIGQDVGDVLYTDKARWAEIRANLDAAPEWTGSLVQRTRAGRRVDVSSRQQLLRLEGQTVVLETNRDMSDVQLARSALAEANAELRHVNRALEDFAYIVSHDLQEPIRGISINAAFMRREPLSPTVEKRAIRISDLCRRVEALMEDVLAYSRIGHNAEVGEVIDLIEMLGDLQDDMREFLNERFGRVVIETDLPPLHANLSAVQSIFRNLVTNALKYNNSGKPIARIRFHDQAEVAGKIWEDVFSVEDNGIGIDASDPDWPFRIFTRLSGAEAFGGGTGAGLAIVRKTVETYGGRITYTSLRGEGTTFWFTLPLAMRSA